MDKTTKKILEVLTEMSSVLATKEDLKNLATKDDIRSLQEQINNHTRQIEANTKAISDMAEQLRGVFGYAKEIDMLMRDMAIVKQKLGIK